MEIQLSGEREVTAQRYGYNPHKALEKALNSILPDGEQERKIERARRLLGETAKDLTDGKIKTIIDQFQHLADCWLDSFEREVFDGATLREVLGEGKNGTTR